jgi:hypothetical protein
MIEFLKFKVNEEETYGIKIMRYSFGMEARG